MDDIQIAPITTQTQAGELDRILWDVLWNPIGLPRNVRDTFKLEDEPIQLIATQGSDVLGGLVAYWLSLSEMELRHIALRPEFQGLSIGATLVRELMAIAGREGCESIQTYARNTSVGFFSKLGFVPLSDEALEHPDFLRHGITFRHMGYTCKTVGT
jgi:N-acetylglutamate synthase-like GNAT family acetyltransferase